MKEKLILLKKSIEEAIENDTGEARLTEAMKEKLKTHMATLVSSSSIPDIRAALIYIDKLTDKKLLKQPVIDVLDKLDEEFGELENKAANNAVVAIAEQVENFKTAMSSLTSQIKAEFEQGNTITQTYMGACTSEPYGIEEAVCLSLDLIAAEEIADSIKTLANQVINSFLAIQIIQSYVKTKQKPEKSAQTTLSFATMQQVLKESMETYKEEERRRQMAASSIENTESQNSSLKRKFEFNLDPGRMSPEEVSNLNQQYYYKKHAGMYEDQVNKAAWRLDFFKEFLTDEEKTTQETKKPENIKDVSKFQY